MKKAELQIILSKLKDFNRPKIKFEQYSTPAEIASDVIYLAYLSGDIENKNIVDLGCGTGVLSIASALLNAKEVYAFDVDEKAIEIAYENKSFVENMYNCKLKIKFDVMNIEEFNLKRKFDTFVMNPPFGIQNKGINLVFLEKAILHSYKGYCLLHSPKKDKERTRDFYRNFASKFNFTMNLIKSYSFKIPKTHFFHRKGFLIAEMDLYMLKKWVGAELNRRSPARKAGVITTRPPTLK